VLENENIEQAEGPENASANKSGSSFFDLDISKNVKKEPGKENSIGVGDEPDKICVICSLTKKEGAFYPCGHICCC